MRLPIQRSHDNDWKQYFNSVDFWFLLTGGSWKKSPTQMSWIPPKGRIVLRIIRAIDSSFSNNSGLIMEISSIMSICVFNQFWRDRWFLKISSVNCSTVLVPRPILAHECTVVAPHYNSVAAHPVKAVIAIFLSRRRAESSIKRIK